MLDLSGKTQEQLSQIVSACDTVVRFMGPDGCYPLPKGYAHDFTSVVLKNDGLPPELLEAVKVLNIAVTGNGAFFDCSHQGFLPSIIEDIFVARSTTKKAMLAAERRYVDTHDDKEDTLKKQLDIKQQALKVTLNSAYGSIANRHFRFFDKRQSEAVTLSGVMIIKWAIVHANLFLNAHFGTVDEDYVIASDTDSIYLSLEKAVPHGCPTNEAIEILDALASGPLEQAIRDAFLKLCAHTNGREPKIWMKREVIANPGIWTGAKYYMLSILDKEGVRYKTPKVKMVGLAAIRSTTPEVVRKRLRNSIKLILWKNESKLQAYIELFRCRFMDMSFHEIAQPSSVGTYSNYVDETKDGLGWKPRTPIAVKAAIVYNRMIAEMNLVGKVEPILPGSKVRWCYLRLPNPTQSEVIAAIDELPSQFGLEDYLDREKQFETVFLSPLRSYCKAIGWRVEETGDLWELVFKQAATEKPDVANVDAGDGDVDDDASGWDEANISEDLGVEI